MTRGLILMLLLLAPSPALASDLCALALDMEARIAERLGYAPGATCPEIAFALPVAGAVQRSQAGPMIR